MDGSLRLIKAVSQFHTVRSYTAFTAQWWLYAHTVDVLKHKYLFHTFPPTYQMPISFSTGSFWLWFDNKFSHKAFDHFNDNAL